MRYLLISIATGFCFPTFRDFAMSSAIFVVILLAKSIEIGIEFVFVSYLMIALVCMIVIVVAGTIESVNEFVFVDDCLIDFFVDDLVESGFGICSGVDGSFLSVLALQISSFQALEKRNALSHSRKQRQATYIFYRPWHTERRYICHRLCARPSPQAHLWHRACRRIFNKITFSRNSSEEVSLSFSFPLHFFVVTFFLELAILYSWTWLFWKYDRFNDV